jgi:phosphoribosylformylglycinamidine synthase
MIYTAHITIMPLKDLLDPQGKAVMSGLSSLGLDDIKEVRIGKLITLQVSADSAESAKEMAEEATKKLLANQVMEHYEILIAS